MGKTFIVAELDNSNEDSFIIVMGHHKPEVGRASSFRDAMMLISTPSKNRFILPKHFPFHPGKPDRIITDLEPHVIPPDPPWPTEHMPGTLEKIEVMAWRMRYGYKIHHPLDARLNTNREWSEAV